ncbi:hypothetical protein ACFFJB_06720 [Camelimonas abortus]|uniref:Uncharacterized protein n=1 Tax=Camelimonas abortus TaxID=1017184 RepID=A0ABV7LDR3_9HYPH
MSSITVTIQSLGPDAGRPYYLENSPGSVTFVPERGSGNDRARTLWYVQNVSSLSQLSKGIYFLLQNVYDLRYLVIGQKVPTQVAFGTSYFAAMATEGQEVKFEPDGTQLQTSVVGYIGAQRPGSTNFYYGVQYAEFSNRMAWIPAPAYPFEHMLVQASSS